MAKIDKYEKILLKKTINVIKSCPATFELHWHNQIEIIALPPSVETTVPHAVSINQNIYELLPGDVLLIWGGELHEILANEDNALIGLQFASTIFNELPDFAPFIHIFRTKHLISHSEEPALADDMHSHIGRIFQVQESNDVFSGVESVIYIYELFMNFGRHLSAVAEESTDFDFEASPKTNRKIKLACDYITENCNQPLTLEVVSDYIGFSTYYFSRIFKIATGLSYIEFLTHQRIRRAQALLADSDLNITEISYQSGFKSISTFNRVFKQYKGCSPSQYRKYYVNA
ncbi:MAG: AraC family transcriptional regulator [Lachnospiraceae bacterium]|nr:AraC family transcriptional regulator [Lachnospiraceae bacterium]